MLKNLLIIIFIIAATAAATIMLDHRSAPPSPPVNQFPPPPQTLSDTVPDFTFTDVKGETHNIADFRSRAVLLNFWASWCGPCVKEFPLLMEIARAYPEKVTIIALSSDFKPEAIDAFLQNHAPDAREIPNLVIALDKNFITANVFQTVRLPETILIDPQGRMRAKLIGANWGMDDIKEFLDIQ